MPEASRYAAAEAAFRRASEAAEALRDAEAEADAAAEKARAPFAQRIIMARARANVAARAAIAAATDPGAAEANAAALRKYTARNAARALSRASESLQKTPPDLPDAAMEASLALRQIRKAAQGADGEILVRHFCNLASRPDPLPVRTGVEGEVLLD